jgi:hypothetical protein
MYKDYSKYICILTFAMADRIKSLRLTWNLLYFYIITECNIRGLALMFKGIMFASTSDFENN